MWSKSFGVIPAFANVAETPIANSGMMIPLTRSSFPLSQNTDHVQYMDARL